MDETRLQEESLVNLEVRHEPSDASARWVLVFAASLIVLGVVIFVSLLWLFRFMLARQAPVQPPPSVLAASQRGQLPPEPRLEGLVPYQRLRATQEVKGPVPPKYGWVDRKARIVSIPVEEAMDTIPTGNLPSRKPEPGSRTWQPEPSRPSSSNSGRTLPGGPR